MSERPRRPGLAKVRTPPILRRRCAELVMTQSGRVLELLESASVVSEGRAQGDHGAVIYYGTTSLLFSFGSVGGPLPDASTADLILALQHDPHTRLQVVRIAHREAWMRSASVLGPIRAELSVKVTTRGILVTVDVEANVLGRRARSKVF